MSLKTFFARTVEPVTTPNVSVIVLPGTVSVLTMIIPSAFISMYVAASRLRFNVDPTSSVDGRRME